MLSLEPTVTPLQEGNAVQREDLAALSHFKIKYIGSRISPAPRSLMATRCEAAPALRPLKWEREECPGLVPCAASGFPHSASGGSLNTEAGQKSNISSRYPQRKKREEEHFRSLKRTSAHMWCRWGVSCSQRCDLPWGVGSGERGNHSPQHKVCILLFSSNCFRRR